MKKEELGLTQVVWGNGKGKTTSALGTALRACGNGYNVFLIQFMKNGAESLEKQIPGEIISLNKFENFKFKRFGVEGWIKNKPTQNQINSSLEALDYLKKNLIDSEFDIIIADEILYAVELGLFTEEDVIEIINKKNSNKELILTGSHTPLKKIFEKADYVSEIKKIKHPYDKGILAREGVEF